MRSRQPDHAEELADLHSVIEGLREEVAALKKAQAGPDEWLKRVTARKILVHQRNDASIEGLLVAHYNDGLVLRSAALLRSGGTSTPMDGEVFIPRDQVALVQLDG